MEVQTFRARSMQEALQMVRRTLGPDAAVLQAREIGRGALPWLTGSRDVEVLASTGVHVPRRFPDASDAAADPDEVAEPPVAPDLPLDDDDQPMPPAHRLDYRTKFREDLKSDRPDRHSLVEQLACGASPDLDLHEGLLRLFTELTEVDIGPAVARQLVQRVQHEARDHELADPSLLKACAARLIERDIACCDPIQFASSPPRVVALIGPTGVGKTTTVAKLAANYRLRERRRVGLITVDTYRIAAVEQLRTYAEIIDLPMEVVSTPREMRRAIDCLSGLELILVDTAGRSPRDEIRIQELRSLLLEAQADEIHLVLSSVTGAASLLNAAERFRPAGVTALLLTKLDEAHALGNLLPLLQTSRLPLSYLTHGQNVPDDIEAANRRTLARRILALDTHGHE
jgi:flagellar biosynthesis protein FlhF